MARYSRRTFLGGLTVGWGLAVACGRTQLKADPPRSSQRHRVGYIAPGTEGSTADSLTALRDGLLELGYVEGATIELQVRYADGREERFGQLAAELVPRVDVIVTGSSPPVRAVRQLSASIPIVFATVNDPVEQGLVASLARPGGNTTGLTLLAGEESGKRLQLLKEAFADIRRVAVLWNQTTAAWLHETMEAATKLGVEILPVQFTRPEELEPLLASAVAGGADGLIVTSDAVFSPLAPRIVAFAAAARLPAIYPSSTYVQPGGLMIYGPNIPANFRRAATYVDKILKGARAGDLPVERPARLDFIINAGTARALGKAIPPEVAAQATEWVQ